MVERRIKSTHMMTHNNRHTYNEKKLKKKKRNL